MPQGIIIKGIGGFYYVKEGCRVLECRARGKFRNEKISPLVGDKVDIIENDNSCVIDNILPRTTVLSRPPVANVSQSIIVFSATRPEPNLNLLDKLLLLCEHNNLEIVICINKADLLTINELDNFIIPYKQAGYRIIYTSTVIGYGIDKLISILKDKVTVFAGPSGVGKSSLLNSVQPSFNMKTGEISNKLQRGKHTTRHTELLELDFGGYVVDTPGFSSLDINYITKDDIAYLMPEFREFIGLCKFPHCSHVNESGCFVRQGVMDGKINLKRYDSYVKIYNEISKIRRKY